mmetsp:Transcript_28567/g.91519  ORF Transcript_28567/g.91519 Transcript_28567/m.91519 type:complete len:357 (+) Transcript_28567:247-1317(+)
MPRLGEEGGRQRLADVDARQAALHLLGERLCKRGRGRRRGRVAHVCALDEPSQPVELFPDGDAGLLLEDEEGEVALVEGVHAFPLLPLGGRVHRLQDLGEGEAGHEAVRPLLHVKAGVEGAEPGEDRAVGGGRQLGRPQLAQRCDAGRGRERLELDARDGGHLVRDPRDELRAHVHLGRRGVVLQHDREARAALGDAHVHLRERVVARRRRLLGGRDHHRRRPKLLRHLTQRDRGSRARVARADADRKRAAAVGYRVDGGPNQRLALAVRHPVGLAQHSHDGRAVAARLCHEAHGLLKAVDVERLVGAKRSGHDGEDAAKVGPGGKPTPSSLQQRGSRGGGRAGTKHVCLFSSWAS